MKDTAIDPIYLPPWRDELGREYGPRSDHAYAEKLRDYALSCAGGGLWDPSEETPSHPVRSRPRERPDADDLGRFVALFWRRLTEEQRGAYEQLYVRGLSLSDAARILGLVRSHVARSHSRLLRRYYAWVRAGR